MYPQSESVELIRTENHYASIRKAEVNLNISKDGTIPGVKRIWGEGSFIFRDLRRKHNYVLVF